VIAVTHSCGTQILSKKVLTPLVMCAIYCLTQWESHLRRSLTIDRATVLHMKGTARMTMIKTVINGREHVIESDHLPDASIAFLLTRGFSEALRNVNAGTTAEILGTKRAPTPKWSAERRAKERATRGLFNDQDLFDAVVLERENDMFKDIMAGEVESRQNGPRLSGLDAMIRDVAIAGLEAMAKRKGLATWDKKSPEWKAALDKAMANASVIALAKQRFEEEQGLDLGDLGE
jgi:hypothetical protein